MTSDVPGRRFSLHADNLGSVDQGAPVYYRGLRVGQVLGRTLDENRRSFTFAVFVDAPHDRLVRDTSRFWNASGIDVSVGANGVSVATESLQSILAGGGAFDTPGIEAPGEEAAADRAFHLFESRRKVDEPVITEKVPYLVEFSGSVGGLHAGSPVQFNGIPVGVVTDVRLEYDAASKRIGIPVTLDLEPQRIAIGGAARALRRHARPGGPGPAGAARVRQPADRRAGRRARLPPRGAAGRAQDGHRLLPRDPLGAGRPRVDQALGQPGPGQARVPADRPAGGPAGPDRAGHRRPD